MAKKNPALQPLRKVNDWIAADLTGPVLRLVRVHEAGGKFSVDDVVSQKFETGTEDEITRFLVKYFAAEKIEHPRVILSIPSRLFISKNVDIPSTEMEEISKIIDLQAGRFTPYSRDEIVIDFLCMATPAQHYTSVFLVIVNRKVAERGFRIFENAGIPVLKIGIASEAMAKIYLEQAGAEADLNAVAGIQVGEESSDLTVIDRNQMVFVRNLPVGSSHFQLDRAAAEEDFLKELNQSLAAYQDQGVGRPIKYLVLTGEPSEIKGLADSIRLGVPPLKEPEGRVEILDPSQRFVYSAKAQKALAAAGPVSLFDLLSCVATASSTKLDVLPKEIKLKRVFRESSKDIITLGVLIMTVFLVISLFLASRIYFRSVKAEKIEHYHQSIFPEARKLESISTKNRVVRKLLENRGRGLYIFDIVTGLIGEDLYLASFGYDSEGNILLVGTAESMSRVFAFVSQLEE
ncbi:MAG: pilus assembly protein PilM, partial [Candidatus Omnitrophica bacterium]|nr:pilus assembly protein PilM [Candidatus Omnitrophota bacterium]